MSKILTHDWQGDLVRFVSPELTPVCFKYFFHNWKSELADIWN